jgi:hypothetical protein
MSSMANATVAYLRQLVPLPVYASLDTYAAEATITDFVTLTGDVFKVGVVIMWNGEEYKNPCKAGLFMTQALRQFLRVEDTKSVTFDGWHRLKVVIGTDVYRLDELLCSEVRRGQAAFTNLRAPELDSNSQRMLLEMIYKNHILRNPNTEQSSFVPDLPTFSNEPYYTPAPTMATMRSMVPVHIPAALKPYMTVLTDCFKRQPIDIINLVHQLPSSVLASITEASPEELAAMMQPHQAHF